MAKGANIGFLNFGIDGDNKELLKKLEQAKKEAVSIEQIFKNIKLNTGGNSISTDVQKAQKESDGLAISSNKVADSVNKQVSSFAKSRQEIEKINTEQQRGLKIAEDAAAKKRTSLANELILSKKASEIEAETARRNILNQQKLQTEIYKTESSKKRAALIGAQGQRDLASAYGLTNKTMFSQRNILQQLSQAAGIYFSVYQVGAFIKELAVVSGEFEKQRVSLAAIIGDADAANKIFNQIKDLAVISPFNFKDLTNYAKQLSAFSIPTNEIFDTTKRLADLSAGLGVDMSRIILAYGQVRSAAVLRGQELRQFTEAGIPLVDQLAKKFSELEGRVVSAGEVFDKISNRQVSFAMIKDIITDLTSEGGKFFQMQELQSATLAGKISNLRDNYDIMLDSIGKANSETLKGALDSFVSIMDNWNDYWNILKTIITAYGVYRAALIATSIIEKTNLAVRKEAILIMRSYAANNISISKTQAVTAAQTEVLTKKINGLKSALAFNPAALALTGITVAIGLIASYVSHQDQLQEELFDTISVFNEQSKSINSHIDRLKELSKVSKDDKDVATERIKILNKLSEIEPTVANAIKDHADNLDILTEAQIKYNNSINIQKFATYAANDGSGLFSDNLLETLKELNKAQNSADMAESRLVRGYNKIEEALSRWNTEGKDVTGTMKNLSDSSIQQLNAIISSTDKISNKIIAIRKLAFNSSGNDRVALFRLSNIISEDDFGTYVRFSQELSKVTESSEAKINDFVDNIKGYLKINNIDIKENESYIRNLIKSWSDLGVAGQKQILLKLGIEWDENTNSDTKLSEWQKLLQNNLGTTITIQTDSNINDVVDEMEKKYKEVKTRMDERKPILLKFGFDFNTNTFPSPLEVNPAIRQLGEGYAADAKDANNLDKAAQSLGKTLKDLYSTKEKGESKDKFTEDLKRQVELVKSAKSEYDKIIKVISKDDAISKIRGISEYSSIGNIDLSDEGYIKYINEQLKKIEKRNTTSAKNVRAAWNKELGQIQIENIIKEATKANEQIEKELSKYKDKYSLYEYIFGKTGDKGQALKIAFGNIFDDAKKEMLRSFNNGNVDLLSRPLIDAADLVKKGWEDAGEGIATVFSSQFGISDSSGKEHEILVTPILPDGSILSPSELEDYVTNVLGDSNDILKADNKGIVIAIDVDRDGTAGRKLHELQQSYYGLSSGIITYRDALISAIDKSTDPEQKKKLQEQLVDFDFTQKSDFTKRMTDLVSEFKSVDDQITIIKAKGEETRLEIEKNADNASRDIVEQRLRANQESVNKQVLDLTNGILQATDSYQRLFEDIADISQKELQYLIDKWKSALANATKNSAGNMVISIDGKEFETTEKEIANFTKRILKTESELRSRNPFKALKDSINDLKNNQSDIARIKAEIESLYASIKLAENSKASGSTDPLNDLIISSSKGKITELQNNLKNLDAKGATGLQKMGTAIGAIGTGISDISQSLSGMFDSLGNEELADTIGLVGELAGAAADIGQGLASKNPVQVIQGIAKGISSIANFHDKKLDRAIKKSQLEVKKLGNAYAQIERTISRQLGAVTESQAKAMVKNQEDQIKELEKQRAAEAKKKKKDNGVISDLDGQIAEAKDKLRYFYEDLAGEQWGISIKDWASQISSALVDAFASGEDAAEAFDRSVADIMKNVIKNMIQMSVIEPAMESLRTKLFGKDGKGGLLGNGTTNLSKSDGAAIVDELMYFKGKVGEAQGIWDYLNNAAKQAGVDLSDMSDSAKDTLSKGIQSITEDTGDLLGSYINAMRAEQAKQGVNIMQLVTIAQLHTDQFANMYAELLRIQLNTLATANNTSAIAQTTKDTYNLLKQATIKGSGTAINLA